MAPMGQITRDRESLVRAYILRQSQIGGGAPSGLPPTGEESTQRESNFIGGLTRKPPKEEAVLKQLGVPSQTHARATKIDADISGMIDSGAYNRELVEIPLSQAPFAIGRSRHLAERHYSEPFYDNVNKCNLFVDDVAKMHGAYLPRIKEIPFTESMGRVTDYDEGHIKQWGERPVLAKDMRQHLDMADFDERKSGTGGVRIVNKPQAKKLADDGELVVAIDIRNGRHSSIIAPNIGSEWSVMYRSDQKNRTEKKNKVGYDEGAFQLYHINPEKYNRYRQGLIDWQNDHRKRQREKQ